MASARDQFKSSFGTFATRERELTRRRAHRDASEARDAERNAATPSDGAAPSGPADRPSA